jgi:uncharacterized membrane protein
MINSELKSLSKKQLKGRWWEAISFNLLYFAIIFIPSFIFEFNNDPNYYSNSELIYNLVTFVIASPIALGFSYFYLNFIKGENKLSNLFWGFTKFGKAFVAYLLTSLITLVGFILLIIPGIILSLMFSQVFYVLADNEDISAIDAMKESARIMKGNKFRYFVLCLSFIGWIIVGAITLGIGFIWIMPYYSITLTNFYKDIRRDTRWLEQ